MGARDTLRTRKITKVLSSKGVTSVSKQVLSSKSIKKQKSFVIKCGVTKVPKQKKSCHQVWCDKCLSRKGWCDKWLVNFLKKNCREKNGQKKREREVWTK
jgi:hypothetical protein